MEVTVDGIVYTFAYYPFFKMEDKRDYYVYGMRMPSDKIERIYVLKQNTNKDTLNALKEYAIYIIKEYLLEDDIMLTASAMDFKKDLKDLISV